MSRTVSAASIAPSMSAGLVAQTITQSGGLAWRASSARVSRRTAGRPIVGMPTAMLRCIVVLLSGQASAARPIASGPHQPGYRLDGDTSSHVQAAANASQQYRATAEPGPSMRQGSAGVETYLSGLGGT